MLIGIFSGFTIDILIKLIATKSDYQEPAYKVVAKEGVIAHLPAREITKQIRAEREKIRYDQFEDYMKVGHNLIKSYWLAIVFMAQEFSFSFLSQILILVFEIAFGFAKTMKSRSDMPSNGIEGDQNKMGFGQLVPLFLLLLPGFAVMELYFGESDLREALEACLLKI